MCSRVAHLHDRQESAARHTEIATRLALGATRGSVCWLLSRQGLLVAAAGAVIGVGIAFVAGRLVASWLYEVRASDPLTRVVLRTLVVIVLAGVILRAQPQIAGRPDVPMPAEAAGNDQIARALVSVFDRADIVALGEAHGRQVDSDLRIALVRDPDFATRVRSIVVEFGSTTEQATLDRYIRGENVTPAQLARVWTTTTPSAFGAWDAQIYRDFFAAVRDVNAKLPADRRIRVFGGDSGPGDHRSREAAAVSVLTQQVLQKRGKALVIYGAGHFYRAAPADYLGSIGEDIGMVRMMETSHPGRTFAVIPLGGPMDPLPGVASGRDADYQKFDRALRTKMRPVLLSLDRLPFRDFTAEEFLGRDLLTCRGPGGCVSVFKGSPLRLGQIADAGVYFGASSGR